MVDPGGGGFHGLGVEAAAVDAAVNLPAQEAGRFKDAEMFGDRGEGHGERLGEGFDGGFALGQAGKNGAASGVRKRGEGRIEGVAVRGIVNHTVYYYAAGWRCQGLFFGLSLTAEERRWPSWPLLKSVVGEQKHARPRPGQARETQVQRTNLAHRGKSVFEVEGDF